MNGSTPWFASRTVWAGIAGIAVPVLGLTLHLNISDAQTAEIVGYLTAAGSAIAGLAAIYGRVKADSPIKGSQAAAAIQPMTPAKGP